MSGTIDDLIEKNAKLFSIVLFVNCKGTSMTTMNAVVRNGRIETEHPINLPDGTKLVIPLPDEVAIDWDAEIEFMTEEQQSDDPAVVRQWIDDLRSIPPMPDACESMMDEAESIRAASLDRGRLQRV